jgi:putative transposase
MFTDESGFLMAPARRTTLAPRGHTPVLPQRAVHRQRVSVAAALWKTPQRELPRLHYGTYPNMFLNAEDYVEFLIEVMQYWPSNQPAIILHDEGGLHLGEPMDDFLDDHRLVEVELLPPYAPELNPVEAIWNHLKLDKMANFAPLDVADLDVVLEDNLWKVQHDTNRLRTFFAASPLEW